VHVVLGDPVRDGDRVELPVRLAGAHLLGAARLAIRFLAERYDVEGAGLDGSPPEWLSLHQVRGDQVVVGLIGLSGGSRSNLVLRLRLKLKPGMPAGGQVTLASADFAGPEGTALEVESGQPTRSLGVLTRLELSIPRPNPFARSTDFAIILAQASQLEVAVYDLAGREVRELFRGGTPAGTLELRWDGRGADGARAAGGLYFLRARGAGQSSSRKLVLLSTP
jgi:hypothetical protein